MIDARLTLRAGKAVKTVALADYLAAAAEERAHEAEYRWIKRLRHAEIEGAPLRDRFRHRDDSLWWFTELYLHKQQVLLDIHRTIAALQNLADRETPAEIIVDGPPIVGYVATGFAALRGIRCSPTIRPVAWLKRLAALDGRARALHVSALAARDRWRVASLPQPATVAAFVHRAFWRSGGERGSAEAYVGPILEELERALGEARIAYVGVGPSSNFRTHRRLSGGTKDPGTAVPVERFAPRSALVSSRERWGRRYADFRAMVRAPSIRESACIEGIDCWPAVREQLAGIAWLQWPWSARAMDEAAAALDALRPRAVVTYAEAGGWGRALVLEARRRRIPSVGFQHGFIYRHWLNYRHERDEMEPTATTPFPLPTRTLVFDDYAARHLVENGRFPLQAIRVTGSPRLDELASELSSIETTQVQALRDEMGIHRSHVIGLVATKEREARPTLAAFLDAASSVRGAVIVIKPHPAESAAVYSGYLAGRQHVRVAPDGTSLALLLASARALITVNSTVALDAGSLGIPALSIGLPNNLSPFVESGAIAGTPDPAELPTLLERILYDENFRQQLASQRRATLGDTTGGGAGLAASRSAEAVIELIGERPA